MNLKQTQTELLEHRIQSMANETLNTAMGSISAAVATVVFFGTVWKFLTDKYQFEDKLKEFNRRKEDLKRFRETTETTMRNQLQGPGNVVRQDVRGWLDAAGVEISEEQSVEYLVKQKGILSLYYRTGIVKARTAELNRAFDNGERLIRQVPWLVNDDASLERFTKQKLRLKAELRDVEGRLISQLVVPGKIEKEEVKLWRGKLEEITGQTATNIETKFNGSVPQEPQFSNLVKEKIREMEELLSSGGALLRESLVVDDYSQTLGDGERQSGFGGRNMVVPLQLLMAITNNFSEENILGRGGFATVYKGEFLGGKKIAVKRMKPGIVNERVLKDFKSEIAVLSRVQHRHLVELLGHWIDENERLLVYEYMPQGTLSRYLFNWNEEGLKPLEWTSRLRIALDVARGVEYLHILAHKSYIHRDIKSTNILLGDDMRAKVADFGFVLQAEHESLSVETRIVGSFGYFAPEYFESGRVTRKADVYSLGVVLMELITGRKALGETIDEETFHLVTWFRKMLTQKGKFREAIDQSIEVDKDTLASIRTVAKLAGRCSAKERDQRPTMNHVVSVLSSLAENWKPAAVTTRKQPKWWKF